MLDGMFSGLLTLEGGAANIPGDRGGVTYAGISSRQYPELLDRIEAQDLSLYEVRDLYFADYYSRIVGWKILERRAPDLLFLLFSGAVHGSGDNHLVELLQRYLNGTVGARLSVDGVWGTKTLDVVRSLSEDQLNDMMFTVYSSVDSLAARRVRSVGVQSVRDGILNRVREEHRLAKQFIARSNDVGGNGVVAKTAVPATPTRSSSGKLIMIDGVMWLEAYIAGAPIFVRQN